MSQTGTVYAQALYCLARDEGCCETVLNELGVLHAGFSEEPDFLRLLSAPNLSKEERCAVLDRSFRGKVHPYVLNFLKLLTEKGYIRHFSDCHKAFRQLHNQEYGILEVTAVTAFPLNADQRDRLTEKLSQITGKAVDLVNRVDAACMGGIRLDYDGKRVEDTVQHRLASVAAMLKNTVL